MRLKNLLSITTLSAMVALAGCQAASTAINKQNLDVQTHMSDTVFLDPVAQDKKTVLVRVRNTSDHPEIDLKAPIVAALQAKGYRLVDDPEGAHFMLQLNVLQAGPFEPANKNAILAAGYGETLLGAGAGAAIGSQIGSGGLGTTLGGAAVGGLLTFAANSMVHDTYVSVVTDIQVSERVKSGVVVKQHTTTAAAQAHGSATHNVTYGTGAMDGSVTANASAHVAGSGKVQNVDETSDFKQYPVRVVAYGNQMNLEFATAAPLLTAKISNSVGGLFD